VLAPAESVPQTPVTPATEPLSLPEPVNNEATISKHPEYVKYFKMLSMGIPSEQIKMKMSMEGKVATALESVLPPFHLQLRISSPQQLIPSRFLFL